MKARLIISDRSWEYRLRAAPQEPGKYFVKLTGPAGEELKHAPITGPFATLDAIHQDAEKIYLRLVAMREANGSAGAQTASNQETSLNHSSEFTHA